MSNKVDILTNGKCNSIFKKLKDEPMTERISFLAPKSLKEDIFKYVNKIRKPTESSHGAMSNFIREAIILHLSRK